MESSPVPPLPFPVTEDEGFFCKGQQHPKTNSDKRSKLRAPLSWGPIFAFLQGQYDLLDLSSWVSEG